MMEDQSAQTAAAQLPVMTMTSRAWQDDGAPARPAGGSNLGVY